MDSIGKIIDLLLSCLPGFYRWTFVTALVVIGFCWWWLGHKKNEIKIARRRMLYSLGVLALWGIIAAVYWFVNPLWVRFPTGISGILVLQITGDDDKRSLQRELVCALNEQLAKESKAVRIIVRGLDIDVNEWRGLTEAHRDARQLGKRYGAEVVIWGTRVGDRKFYPRLTLVRKETPSDIMGNVQNISEANLPAELINQPISLAHFAAGYTCYALNRHTEALLHFAAAIKAGPPSMREWMAIAFYSADCHLRLSEQQSCADEYRKEAIALYEIILQGIGPKENQPKNWAIAHMNLGRAYRKLQSGDRIGNIQKAIASYESALQVWTQTGDPYNWAETQYGLAEAYCLSAEDRVNNQWKKINYYKAALQVWSEINYPQQWAGLQCALGNSYSAMPTKNRETDNKIAISFHEAALRVWTERDFPQQWAATQMNLAHCHRGLNTKEHLQEAITHFENASRVWTESEQPGDWAWAQRGIAEILLQITGPNDKGNLEKAREHIACAKRGYTSAGMKQESEWAGNTLTKIDIQLREQIKL